MKKVAPWPSSDPPIPVDATTVELEPQELLEAVAMYVGTKLGENYKGTATLHVRCGRGKIARAQLSFWRPS
jgi:hypothetical protein